MDRGSFHTEIMAPTEITQIGEVTVTGGKKGGVVRGGGVKEVTVQRRSW